MSEGDNVEGVGAAVEGSDEVVVLLLPAVEHFHLILVTAMGGRKRTSVSKAPFSITDLIYAKYWICKSQLYLKSEI